MRNDTLVDRLRRHAAVQPEARALRFLDGDALAADLSYAELDARIRAVAACLQQNAPAGERAVLLFPSGVDYVVAFHACLYAGLIAVPAYPPERGRAQHAERLRGILRDAEPRLILTTSGLRGAVTAELPPGTQARVLAIDAVPQSAAGDWREGSPAPDSIAFLQYTSGSTSSPKGVRVTHASLDANEIAFTTGFGMSRDDVFVSWLPLYHDMGLIGGLIQPLHLGIPAVLMSPKSFVERPRRWLEAFARFGGTVSGAPDFAYALCADRIGEAAAAELDLSSWRLAFNGAEFVRAATLERFTRRFALSGFSPGAFFPCYGLAEATLFVSGGVRGEGAHVGSFEPTALASGRVTEADNGSRHVALGHIPPGHAVRIMRENGAGPAEPDTIGEIWVSGPSVADGYWRNEAATEAAFVVDDGARWLRTGDLGFERDGRLYVTGRIKDMLIVRGENLFPQDIEQAVEAEVEAVRRGRVAAFPVEVEGREGIGVAAEFGRGVTKLVPAEALRDAIAKVVARQCGEAPAVVVILNPRGMPLTTSGKLQRSACAALWARDDGLDSVAVFVGGLRRGERAPGAGSPLSGTEAIVAGIWGTVLGRKGIAREDDFFLIGGNSIAAAQAAASLRERCRVELDLGAFFAHPTLRALSAHVDGLPRSGAGAVPPITATDRARPLALSHAQARLWFLWQMEPASTAYTVAASIHLTGALDSDALLRALDGVVARHEALRTTFEAGEGGAIQIVHPHASLPTTSEDLSGLDPARRTEALERLKREALAVPFDLTSGPLLRATLIRLGEGEHALLLTAHHIVIDGVSMGVLLDELAALYSGTAPEPLGVQYADYAAWQRDWLGAGEGERQLGFWREALGREHPVLALPLDRPRPAAQSHRGDSVALVIDADLAGRLRALAASERASVFMVLHAAYALLLHRYTGESDIRIGVPTANRRLKPLERLIGFFVNTLVLRTSIEPGRSFAELVAATKQVAVSALAHQDVPFERLVENLQPERSLGHNPLFQAKFNYMAEPRGFDIVEGLDVTVRILDLAGAHFDLALDILDGPEGMTATFNYATDLFDRSTVEGLAAQFADFLTQAAEAPSRALQDFRLQEKNRRQTPTEEVVFPAETVLDLFRRTAVANPDATALADADATLSYAGLDARSDTIARALLARGLAPEAPVGLLIERSIPFVAGLLGAMKAGAAVVLLEPSWPEGRVRAVLDDAGIGLLLSAGPALPMARASGRSVLDVALIEEASAPTLPPMPDPRRIAYIVYTSGSTGRPKGVAVPHGALANYVQAILAQLAPEPGWSMAMASTVAADLGHTVLFGALCCGACLHLVPADDAFDAERFAARMRGQGDGRAIDVLKIVPSHLNGLLRAETSGDVLPRRVLVLGGEALDPALVAEIRRLRPSLRIVNHYGPTETTVGVLSHEVAPDSTDAAVPLGLPLANLRAHVLDASLGPVPGGVAGELLIGGAGLARGYQRAPALTAERFVPDPFGPPGSRLYRTGDRVRGDREGRLHFLGRSDDQIKLRGYRIEPGEIARVLTAREDVREAVVLAQAVPADEERRQLVAYVTPAPGASPDTTALKEHLAAGLPDYMVPAHVIVMERLPLTGNGKVDRKALPLPEAADAGRRRDAPEGEVEEAMAEVWAQVLRLEEVGATDNFFELGGDSILSLQVIARLRKRGIKLTPKQIFDRQTIRSLATVAGTAAPKAPAPAAAAATQGIPLLPIQDRFFAEVTLDRHHWNQALLLKPREPLDADALARALKAVVERHDALRLRFTESASGWAAAPGAAKARPDLLRRESVTGWEAATALCAEAQASLDLASGRLVQALLLDVAGAGQRLLIAIHHLAVDGVSWRILLEDIAAAYAQAKAGEPIALGAGTDSVATWASRLHALAAGGTLSSELPFWLGQNADGVAPLPFDRELPAPQTLADAGTLVTELDADLKASLLAKAPAAYRTQVNDLLLAALLRALGRWSGTESALVELEGHGREDVFPEADVSRTVGWFTSTFPLRLDGASAETGDLIKGVKERLRALPNRGLGFGLLSRLGTAEQRATLAQLTEPQITFNYLGRFDASFGPDALFARAEEDAGPPRSLRAPLTRALVVDGDVCEGRLRLCWRYGRARHDRATVERLAALYAEALREVVAHCVSGAGGLTPSDLPLCGLDQRGLDAFLARTRLDPRGIEDVYPLSPTQQGILFHALGDGEASRTYVNQIAVTVSGLDPARICAAWEAATRRHAVLRTSIHWQGIDGAALQVVHRDPVLPFAAEDGTDIAQAERTEREAGFALERAPLQRVRLIRLDAGEDGAARHRLIWTTHHVLMDGWSSARLMAEIMAEAGGEARGEGTAGRYRDYIAWLGTRDRAAAETFWRDQLARLEEPTRLVDALLREEPAGSGQGSARTGLDGAGFAALQAFARRERVTLNTLVQGAWALLVRRLTGRDAVAFGATVAGRPAELPGAQETLGLFIATLPIVDLAAPEAAVGPWLRALQDRNLAAREHEHLPLHEIQRLAGRPGQPLFDSIVVFENYPVDEALKAPAFTELRHVSATNYPLTLSAFATPERLDLHLDHDLGQVSASAASLLADLLTDLLRTLATDAERRLGTIALNLAGVDARPAQPDMAAGSDPAAHLPVHLAFARQARERPDAEALRCGTQSLTYAELDTRASRLAHTLAAHGIGPGAVVGVAMPRTMALVVALIAVMKTGAAYAPLDPATPPKRLVQALADTGATLLLAEPALRALLTERPCRVRSPAELEASVPQGAAADIAIHPESLAYVIHTSGSTGTPKGVAVAHGPFAMHCRATAALYETGPSSRELLFLSFAFDAAHERLWSALSVGASLVLRDDALWTPEQTLDAIARERCTHIDLPPAYLRELADFASERGGAPRLEVCSFGGEAMLASVLEDVARSLSPRLLINGYGPTETVVTPLAWKVPASAPPTASGPSAPIGRAVGARHALLLDADAQPLPAGATAELFVGGEGLAQSYLGQPSLTAERFLPDPFGAPGSRMYRTGDRAARQPDGTVLYRGRSDDQVKIRGHRIEPGEVEARLRALPGIAAATVIARPGTSGLRLIAYAVPKTGAPLDGPALRVALAEILPGHMVPSHVVVLARLPVTPGGKVDRRALPEPDAPDTAAHVAPRTDTERALAAIWRAVLGLDRIGVTDSFFDIGGDSIQAIRVVSRMRERFDRPLTPKDVFDTLTIEELARRIDEPADGSQDTAKRLDALLSAFEDA